MTEEQYSEMQKKALEQLFTGKPLLGKDGAFAPLLKQFLETALKEEMEAHLNAEAREQGNKRNGKGKKTLKTAVGEVEIETPQDRKSEFEPQIIKKRERIITEGLTSKIISLYSKGMSLRDISQYIEEMYGSRISPGTISQITDKIIPEIKTWQNRALDSVYPIVFMDAMHYKVREEGKISNRAVYNIIGITIEGHKELLGMYVSENEGANFWLQVLTDLQNRGLQDILIACIDNLKGFSEAILTIYPKCEIQLCVVHQIRNSFKYISYKDKSVFMNELKQVYQADTLAMAEINLEQLSMKWEKKYPIVIKSWKNNWEQLTTYFKYTAGIRKLIYTTNIVEGFHRQIRKVTKTKGSFTSDMALLKLIYLTSQEVLKGMQKPIPNWPLTIQQLSIHFGERLGIKI